MKTIAERINELIEGNSKEVVKIIFEECMRTYKQPFKMATCSITKTYYQEDGVSSLEEAREQFIEDVANNNFEIKGDEE